MEFINYGYSVTVSTGPVRFKFRKVPAMLHRVIFVIIMSHANAALCGKYCGETTEASASPSSSNGHSEKPSCDFSEGAWCDDDASKAAKAHNKGSLCAATRHRHEKHYMPPRVWDCSYPRKCNKTYASNSLFHGHFGCHFRVDYAAFWTVRCAQLVHICSAWHARLTFHIHSCSDYYSTTFNSRIKTRQSG